MEIVIKSPVDFSLAMLRPDDRQVVLGWFDRLKNWDTDAEIRGMCHRLAYKGVYMLAPPDRNRIFFDKGEDTITILDLASKETVEAFAGK